MIIETVLLFIAIILLLVVSHELGHFFVSKYYNVRVDEFGVGLPPRLFGVQKGETLYSFNLLPFGGFVKIFGEEEESTDPRSFFAQPVRRKVFIVAAGVMANVLVGFVIFSFLAWYGTPRFVVEVASVAPDSPAEIAGFMAGDIITGFEDVESAALSIDEVQAHIAESKGKSTQFFLNRKGIRLTVGATPRQEAPSGEGPLGIVITPKEAGLLRTTIFLAPIEGAKKTGYAISQLFVGLLFFFKELFVTGQSPGEILGPVGIAGVARTSFDIGIRYFLELIAFLSLNLAVINILPIPALDGGRILFFAIEKISGRVIPARVAGTIHSAFFVLLIMFLVWVTYYDILRLI